MNNTLELSTTIIQVFKELNFNIHNICKALSVEPFNLPERTL